MVGWLVISVTSPGTNEAVGHGVNQLTRDSEITYLDLALRIDEDVAWLHIPAATNVIH